MFRLRHSLTATSGTGVASLIGDLKGNQLNDQHIPFLRREVRTYGHCSNCSTNGNAPPKQDRVFVSVFEPERQGCLTLA